MKKTREHIRINDIFLGPLERPALNWLAAHMPDWVTPDICTITAMFGAFLTMISYGLSNYNPNYLWLASLGLVLHWLGDSLDGTLARYRRIERPMYGYFIDHTTDMVSIVMIFLGLGFTPYISFNIACVALIAFLLMCALVYLRTYVAGEFKISYGGLGPTEMRVVAILLNTSMYFTGLWTLSISQTEISVYNLVIAGIALVILSFFLNVALREAFRLAALEKRPASSPSSQREPLA